MRRYLLVCNTKTCVGALGARGHLVLLAQVYVSTAVGTAVISSAGLFAGVVKLSH